MTSMNRFYVRRWLIPLALLASASAAASSCSDPSPVGVAPPTLAARRVGGGRLVSCTPLAYDSVTRVIGPAGGFLVAGGHVLVVDSLALSSPVTITVVAPSQSVNVVRFRPEGLKFRTGAHGIGALVATNLDNCNVHAGQVLQVVNVTDSLSILGILQAPTTTDSAVVVKYKTYLGSLWVGGRLQHFSNYAVAW
jgi:hypothetical protein